MSVIAFKVSCILKGTSLMNINIIPRYTTNDYIIMIGKPDGVGTSHYLCYYA